MSCELQTEVRSVLLTNLVVTATSLEGLKKIRDSRSFTYNQSSTNPANFVKIGPVDVAIIDLTLITKIFLNSSKT